MPDAKSLRLDHLADAVMDAMELSTETHKRLEEIERQRATATEAAGASSNSSGTFGAED